MKEVWIFGDSYVDRHYTGCDTSYNWPRELENKYVVKNFGKSGTGPTWSLYYLINEMQTCNCRDITLIFFVSEIFRLDLDFFEPKDQTLIYNFLTNNNGIENDLFNQKKAQYNEWLPFIDKLWDQLISTQSFRQTELLKIISSIQLLSQSFKKTLIWPCFDLLPVTIKNINRTTVVDYSLVELDNNNYDYCLDPRVNHLSKTNHEIMLKLLCDWIDNDLPIDPTKFVNSSLI
jgi:hypothetical protein